MFKVLTVKQEFGGTIQYERDVAIRAAAELEKQLNDPLIGVTGVHSVGIHEGDHDLILIAAVSVADTKQGE